MDSTLARLDLMIMLKTIKKNIPGMRCYKIAFRGLTASPSCLMVQGFIENNFLNQVRDTLRIDFKNTDIEQSMDKKYAIQT